MSSAHVPDPGTGEPCPADFILYFAHSTLYSTNHLDLKWLYWKNGKYQNLQDMGAPHQQL